ncbi:MAG: hypothetical protein PUB37_00800 [Firmicutes bacterium]|nr:hypothetical protein [Bacillota bacterium]
MKASKNVVKICLSFAAAVILCLFVTACSQNEKNELDVPLQIAVKTDIEKGRTIEINMDISEAYIDWGDGEPVFCVGQVWDESWIYDETSVNVVMYSGELKGNTVKVYSGSDITTFDCSAQKITALDVTNAKKLKYLMCRENKLSSLNISQNQSLELLECCDNELSKLDVSKNIKLKNLECFNNDLSKLDVSANKELYALYCSGNNLSSLDLSNLRDLKYLEFSDNSLSQIDLSKNSKLYDIACQNNQLTELNITQNHALVSLYCENNNLSEIDLTQNYELEYFHCNENFLVKLDTSKNKNLETVNCSNNNLTELDFSNNCELEGLLCNGNELTKLNISNTKALKGYNISCNDNPLKFSGIIIGDETVEIRCGTMRPLKIAEEVESGGTVDLSSEYNVGGAETVYTWYKYDPTKLNAFVSSSDMVQVQPNKAENGIFTFGDEFVGQSLYCVMTNEKYDGVIIKSTVVKIVEKGHALKTTDNQKSHSIDTVAVVSISICAVTVVLVIAAVLFRKMKRSKAKNKS